ncbi:DUF6483 family protein [Companilactobacillus futsaii]|uniref:Uncharacterized protein n=2 Tax=Companilactobacillus futsaii TaxID=938155 RepID=A0A5B7T0I0_9LACO|nr:DUF6483 family protein [Companilactobacillus futsaii]KRK96657.1 hypothetical protein FC88_GL002109 [Companilactobacillus futsaii JCM 17355]QCX24054.1 hypothetical protein FG051_02575 [Companilactobacillus futsaii]
MAEDSDFIMRQIKSFAEGFGYMVGKKDGEKTEVVFEQQQGQGDKIHRDLTELLMHEKYEQAIQYVYAQKFTLGEEQYFALGQWLLEKLSKISEIDQAMITGFKGNIEKHRPVI